MLKVVLGTSVLVSALLTKDKTSGSAQILSNWRLGRFTLVMSPQTFEELVLVLYRRNISETAIENLVAAITATALHIPGAYEATRLDNIDPKDNIFIAAAYEQKQIIWLVLTLNIYYHSSIIMVHKSYCLHSFYQH